MSKEMSTVPAIILDRIDKGMSWDSIAAEATFEISKAQARIRKLRETLRFCRERKKNGDPIPVSVAAEPENVSTQN